MRKVDETREIGKGNTLEIKDIWQLVEGCPGSRGSRDSERFGAETRAGTSIHAAMNDKPPAPHEKRGKISLSRERIVPFAPFYSRSSEGKERKNVQIEFRTDNFQLQFRDRS